MLQNDVRGTARPPVWEVRREMVSVGDKVMRRPSISLVEPDEMNAAGRRNGRATTAKVEGTVVWVHPKKRFYVVEFECNGYKIRETFYSTS